MPTYWGCGWDLMPPTVKQPQDRRRPRGVTMGKPSKGTKKDRRLSANKPKPRTKKGR